MLKQREDLETCISSDELKQVLGKYGNSAYNDCISNVSYYNKQVIKPIYSNRHNKVIKTRVFNSYWDINILLKYFNNKLLRTKKEQRVIRLKYIIDNLEKYKFEQSFILTVN